MRDNEIDEILRQNPGETDPALLDRISGRLVSSLQPVRPMAPSWLLAIALFLSSTVIAVAGAGVLGFHGLAHLNRAEIAWIFPLLAVLAWAASRLSAGETIPGAMLPVNATALLTLCVLATVAVFALLFHNYSTAGFVPQGVPCLAAGLLTAVPAGLVAWLILRRGLALNPAAAGLAAGTLAGLAGVAMLELHCPNQHALHVMFWHAAVIPLAALAGALLARIR